MATWRVFYDTTQSVGSSLRSVHLAPGGGWGAVFPPERGWAQISSHGPQGAAAKCSLGFRELLDQMEMPAGTLKADSREDL